jgi:DNA-binding transcriptional MerR regulator
MNNKAPDAFRTISEVAEELDLPQHVLRFWETRFSQIKPLKRGGGRRYYRPDDVDLLRGIRHLLYGEGYTIRGAQRILKDHGIRFVQTVWQAGAPQPQKAPEDVDEGRAPEQEGEGTGEGGRRLFGLLPSVLAHDEDVAEGPEAPALRREPSLIEAPRTSPAEGRELAPAAAASNGQQAETAARRDTAALRAAIGGDQRRMLEATLRELTECRRLLDTVLDEKV